MATAAGVDNRLLPLTRRALAVASLLVLAAGFQLFVLTDHTDRYFAWTIAAGLTAAVLGAFYWASLALLLLALRAGTWGSVRSTLPGVALFTTLTLVATFLHLGLFHLDSEDLITRLVTWAWVVVYVVAPAAFVGAYVLELRRGGTAGPRTAPMTPWFRSSFGALGAALVGVGIALFAAPNTMASVWAWPLTPLTAQAIGAWLVGIGGTQVGAVLDGDLSRAVPAAAAAVALAALVLIAVARYSDEVVWTGGRGALLLGVAVVLGVGGTYALRTARSSRRELSQRFTE